MRRLPNLFAALRARTGMRRVLTAYAVFDFVEFAGWMAVILWAFDAGGAQLASVAAVVQLAPAALFGPALATIGDRLPRGTALVAAHGAVAVGVVATWTALATSQPTAVVIGVAALLTTLIAVVRPIHFAALPQLATGPAELVSANALSSMLDGSLRFVGPVVAGIVVAASSPATALAVIAVVAATAPVLCLGLPLAAPVASDGVEESGLSAALGGLRAMRGDYAALALLVVLAVDFTVTGALDIVGVAYSVDVLDMGESGAGLIIGALGIGGLVGAVAGSAVSHGRRVGRAVVAGAFLEGIAIGLVALMGTLPLAMIAVALSGVGGAVMLVAGRTLLQRATDDRILARVFALQESMTLIGILIGAALAPLLLDVFGPERAFLPLGILVIVVALLCFRPVQRLEARAQYLPTELALLRHVPFLSVLPAYDLERLARTSRWIDVPAGEAVVRQGERGHEFYVVSAGEATVTIDGVRKDVTLAPGGFFGEIALLHSRPRTATVAAGTDLRLLVVSGDRFLAAVTGHPDGTAVLAEVATNYRDLDTR